MSRLGRFLLLLAVGWAVGASADLAAAQLGFTTREALLVSVPTCLVLGFLLRGWYGGRAPGVDTL